MKRIIKPFFRERFRTAQQIATVIVCIVAVVYFMPREKGFNKIFNYDRPWNYSELIAGFDFPVYKSEKQQEYERDSIRRQFKPYFIKDTTVVSEVLAAFEKRYHNNFVEIIGYDTYINYRRKLIELYERGIVGSNDLERANINEESDIMLINDKLARMCNVADLVKKPEAYRMLVKGDTIPIEVRNRLQLEELIKSNVIYDEETSLQDLNEKLDSLPLGNTLILRGQRLISRGEVVDSAKYQVIDSYKKELELRIDKNSTARPQLLIGQALFIALLFAALLAYMYIYEPRVVASNRFLLVVLSAAVFPIIVGVMMQTKTGHVFLLPMAIIPILLCLFVGHNSAFVTHCISIIACSVMLNSPYEFVMLQIPAGLVAILCMRELSSRSQLFRCVLFVFLTYTFLYFCYQLIIEDDINNIPIIEFVYFVVNAILLLMTYPLMFVIEKLFGFVSNVTLIEISNINSKLLTKLSQDAPGTFQHSMQVSNLAADAARSIGANSLEVRTGALFHDIGKLQNPIYFTENQSGGITPHANLTPIESAEIIIKHVEDGMALARKHHLPHSIRDFILTHHGTSVMKYFYTTYKNEHLDEDVDESLFRYKGRMPFTREQAILMLADCVEAASHSIKEYTADNIDKMVENVVNSRVAEGELAESPLTFRDIYIIKGVFKERLKAIYHTRISYPQEKQQSE